MLTETQAYILTAALAVLAVAEWTYICYRMRSDARRYRGGAR